jgi:uncharacterized membrane protein
MSQAHQASADERFELILANLLRAGVLLSAAVVLAGGIVYLVRHGSEPAEHRVFRGEPAELRTPWGTVKAAWELRGRGLIQLGLLLLIATPVARVVFTFFAFLRQRDYPYVAVTLIVMTVLLYGLFGGQP